jgi:hypothetical protein
MQGLGDAVFKKVLQSVCSDGVGLTEITGQAGQSFCSFLHALLCLGLTFALQSQAIVDEGFDGFAALLLGFGHGPQASQPDVLCCRVRSFGCLV